MKDVAAETSRSSLTRVLLLLMLTSGLACSWARFHGDIAAPLENSSLRCPEGCYCLETTGLVNCSNGNWTYIPAMPSFARQAFFDYNNLHNINGTILNNLTTNGAEVLWLSLTGNSINSFTRNSFNRLIHLQKLTLEKMSRNTSMFMEMFQDLNTLVNLTSLSLSKNPLGNNGLLPPGFLQTLGNSSLSRLYLTGANYTMYNHSDFLPLKNLRHLSLGKNGIERVHLATSDTLQELVLDHNKIAYFPNFCQNESHKDPYFKNLQLLILGSNYISLVDNSMLRCLPELRNISLWGNGLVKIITNTFADLPKLEGAFLYSMRSNSLTLFDYAFNNSNIRSILLFNNRIDFKRDVHLGAFYGCTRLQKIDIGHNMMNTFPVDDFMKMFGHLSNLEVLRIIGSRLDNLPFNNLNVFPNLSTIDVSFNNLHSLDPRPFRGLQKLRTLNASHNQIQSLDETLKPVFDRLEHINLAFNSFNCDCRLLWFKDYLRANYTRFYYHGQGYRCATPLDVQNSSVSSLLLSKTTCLLPQDVGLVIVVCCCVVILLTVAVALRWRYRWDLHFLLLVLERRHSRRRPVAFSHDYYVSADMDSDTDRMWVLQQLMPRLTHFGLRACSAEDTTPGHPELSSALTAMMEQCQRVLFVVSNDYAQSGRCQFELTLALKASLELQRQDITVILLEPIASRYVSSALQVLVKEFACLPWPTDSADLETARDRFWETLHSALVPREDMA